MVAATTTSAAARCAAARLAAAPYSTTTAIATITMATPSGVVMRRRRRGNRASASSASSSAAIIFCVPPVFMTLLLLLLLCELCLQSDGLLLPRPAGNRAAASSPPPFFPLLRHRRVPKSLQSTARRRENCCCSCSSSRCGGSPRRRLSPFAVGGRRLLPSAGAGSTTTARSLSSKTDAGGAEGRHQGGKVGGGGEKRLEEPPPAEGDDEEEKAAAPEASSSPSSEGTSVPRFGIGGGESRRKMELMWCAKDYCKDAVRERVVGEHNQILLNGPATGQVVYVWKASAQTATATAKPPFLLPESDGAGAASQRHDKSRLTGEEDDGGDDDVAPPSVYLLVKQADDRLIELAADAVRDLTRRMRINVLLDPTAAARLKHHYGVDDESIHLFEVAPAPGFGSNLRLQSSEADVTSQPWIVGDWTADGRGGGAFASSVGRRGRFGGGGAVPEVPATIGESSPDLICTLGGDGLLMHAAMMFQGPVPPILCVAGGSMGFLTPFKPEEMVDAIQIALGVVLNRVEDAGSQGIGGSGISDDAPTKSPLERQSAGPNGALVPVSDSSDGGHNFSFGVNSMICLSIRMRLECRIINHEGVIRSRYNVLNEVVIDRGSSPYLAALECFCDDVHLTTVQADGVIFATPTGSTAYSLAAGSSVVHPAVPCILVTPICPHVLSFRSMVFPDHVVLRCFVPDDARAEASVAFDGKHRQELRRGDSVQVQMSAYPVPTINRHDHSSDWLCSLKRNFNFNTRARQKPL